MGSGAQVVALGSAPARNVPDGFPLEQAWDQLVAWPAGAARLAAAVRITLAIEALNTSESNVLNTLASALAMAREVNHPLVQLLVDSYHHTCCRQGELLSLQWGDVSLDRGEITLKAQKTKTREHRVIPISQQLRGVLEMARTGPDGEDFPATAFVSGNEGGERQLKIKRAWQTTVLKAHDHQPTWIRKAKAGPALPCGPRLSPQSQAVYRSINLHFHDLRREAGSRLLEAGWPVHHVQHMLGHANLSQTSTYLNPTAIGLQESMRKLEETRAACKVVANGAVCAPRPVCKDDSHHPDNVLIH